MKETGHYGRNKEKNKFRKGNQKMAVTFKPRPVGGEESSHTKGSL